MTSKIRQKLFLQYLHGEVVLNVICRTCSDGKLCDLDFCWCWSGFLLWLICISFVTDLNSYCGWLGFLLWRTLCLVVTVFPFPFNQDRKCLPISRKLQKILFTKLSRWSCWWWKILVLVYLTTINICVSHNNAKFVSKKLLRFLQKIFGFVSKLLRFLQKRTTGGTFGTSRDLSLVKSK